VVLLGQNVNSYWDRTTAEGASPYETSEGFSNMYKTRHAPGARFADLLDQVSRIDPEMRIRCVRAGACHGGRDG
jgi:tRNA A37 methylthiotransferase MiaB